MLCTLEARYPFLECPRTCTRLAFDTFRLALGFESFAFSFITHHLLPRPDLSIAEVATGLAVCGPRYQRSHNERKASVYWDVLIDIFFYNGLSPDLFLMIFCRLQLISGWISIARFFKYLYSMVSQASIQEKLWLSVFIVDF